MTIVTKDDIDVKRFVAEFHKWPLEKRADFQEAYDKLLAKSQELEDGWWKARESGKSALEKWYFPRLCRIDRLMLKLCEKVLKN